MENLPRLHASSGRIAPPQVPLEHRLVTYSNHRAAFLIQKWQIMPLKCSMYRHEVLNWPIVRTQLWRVDGFELVLFSEVAFFMGYSCFSV